MEIRAPAKINLSLRVLGKRPDGFHEIESLMAPLTLADTLTLEPAPRFSFTCSETSLPTDDSNLVVRAARRFFATTKEKTSAAGHNAPSHSVAIHLEKRIPHGAGLGGGSSDAATTLLGLNALFASPLSQKEIHALAAELGSDVPFFLAGGAAMCRGRGEILEPLPLAAPLRLPLLLLKPPFGVPTPWAYSRWSAALELPDIPYGPQALPELPGGVLVNDLERPVFEKYLFLALLKRWLLQQPETRGALLSGSGSTCFAVLKNMEAGPALEARTQETFGELWGCPCQTAC